MASEYVLAVYRPKPGMEDELKALLLRHQPLLASHGLGANRSGVILQSARDGTFVELLEWVSEDAAGEAHENGEIMALWNELGRCADQLTLSDLPESSEQFPHFRAVAPLPEEG